MELWPSCCGLPCPGHSLRTGPPNKHFLLNDTLITTETGATLHLQVYEIGLEIKHLLIVNHEETYFKQPFGVYNNIIYLRGKKFFHLEEGYTCLFSCKIKSWLTI